MFGYNIPANRLPSLSEDVSGNINVRAGLNIGGVSGTEGNANIYGAAVIFDTPEAQAALDSPFRIEQITDLTGNLDAPAVIFRRRGALNGFDYIEPVALIVDTTASAQPMLQVYKQGSLIFEMNGAGGIGVFGHASPATPRVLAQSVINAITDANDKAAIQACANALADIGQLTLT